EIASPSVTVYGPVASVPAAKTALLPVVHPAMTPVPPPSAPVASVFQFASVVLQSPVGEAPPDPAVAPFTSQKTMSARTASRGQATVAKSERIRATLNQRPYDLVLDRGGVPARRFAPFA